MLALLSLCKLASAVRLMLCYRRSTGEVRQQTKRIAFATLFMGVVYLAVMSAGAINWLALAPEPPSDLGVQSL